MTVLVHKEVLFANYIIQYYCCCFLLSFSCICFVNYHIILLPITWAALCENVILGIYEQQRPGSDCACAQSDQSLRCPHSGSLDTIECISGEQIPGWDFAHVQDVNPHILRMLEGIFSLEAIHMSLSQTCEKISLSMRKIRRLKVLDTLRGRQLYQNCLTSLRCLITVCVHYRTIFEELDDENNGLVFYVFFNIIQLISRRCKGDNERLCAMKRRTVMNWIPPLTGFEPGTAWFEFGSINHSTTRTLLIVELEPMPCP